MNKRSKEYLISERKKILKSFTENAGGNRKVETEALKGASKALYRPALRAKTPRRCLKGRLGCQNC